jgi:hypothetical protein
MTTLDAPSRSDLHVRRLPLVAGVLAVGMAVHHVATPGPPGATFGSLSDWLRDGLFLGLLCSAVAAAWSVRPDGLVPRASLRLLTVAYGMLALGVSAGLVLQDDPSWFMFLGGPGILLSAAAYVWWAAWGRRRGVLPGWAALLCGVGGLVVIVAAEFGTSVLLGGFWLYLAFRDHQTRS